MSDSHAASPSAAELTELTAEIVSAYVAKNNLPMSELPALLRNVHAALGGLGSPVREEPKREALVPAVSIKKSITDDYIISLEDGQKFKSLKRHLMTTYGMTPQDYRTKWNLPKDYPMVAPGYASQRSALAKSLGLGRKSYLTPLAEVTSQPEAAVSEPEAVVAKKAGRPRKKIAKAAAA